MILINLLNARKMMMCGIIGNKGRLQIRYSI